MITMVSLLWTSQHQNTRFQHRRLKTETLAVARKQFFHSRVLLGQSVNCPEQLHPRITRFSWNLIGRHSDTEVLFSLDRATSVESLLHISKLQFVPVAANRLDKYMSMSP